MKELYEKTEKGREHVDAFTEARDNFTKMWVNSRKDDNTKELLQDFVGYEKEMTTLGGVLTNTFFEWQRQSEWMKKKPDELS